MGLSNRLMYTEKYTPDYSEAQAWIQFLSIETERMQPTLWCLSDVVAFYVAALSSISTVPRV